MKRIFVTLASWGLMIPAYSTSLAVDDLRLWKSADGKFEVRASLVSKSSADAVLKKEDGKEIRVPLAQLSNEDRSYLKSSKLDTDNQSDILRKQASTFYESLRTRQRSEASDMLTDAAQQLAKDDRSALANLPKPDEGAKSIRVGKIDIDGSEASVPVVVKAGGELCRTTLHFVTDDTKQWRVFAISAKLGRDEHTINFEAPVAAPTEKRQDPIADLIGKPIELTGVTLAGKPVSLEDHAGKVVLIDFWATWCGPCRAEIPNILNNYRTYSKAGFDVLAVSTDTDLEKLADFINAENPPWTVLADRHPKNAQSMARKFGISGIPTFILVGKDGVVIDANCRGERLGKKLKEVFGF